MINKRNVLTLVLALALTIGSLNVIMAESVSSVGEFVPDRRIKSAKGYVEQ